MKKFLFLTMALAVLCSVSAQEKIKVHNGAESYVTTIEYVTFDVAASDEVVSVADLKSSNAEISAQISTLSTSNAQLQADKKVLADKVAALSDKNNTLGAEVGALAEKNTELSTAHASLSAENAQLTALVSQLEQELENVQTNGHQWVDLGLSSGTLWATCNVGAMVPEDFGRCFTWGEVASHAAEIEPYGEFKNYKWINDQGYLTKYCNYSKMGKVDNLLELEEADDAAVQQWKGNWRMPTKDQQKELVNECYWVWVASYKGSNVSGYIVYKAKNESDKGAVVVSGGSPSANYNVDDDVHIFLPLAGCYHGDKLAAVGNECNFWSSSLFTASTPMPLRAFVLKIVKSSLGVTYDQRVNGNYVRAIYVPKP